MIGPMRSSLLWMSMLGALACKKAREPVVVDTDCEGAECGETGSVNPFLTIERPSEPEQ